MIAKRIIKISGHRIFLTPEYFIPLEQTNFPQESCAFRELEDFFWELSIQAYDKERALLRAEVANYRNVNPEPFYQQKKKRPVRAIHFEQLEWKQLQGFLSFYQKSALEPLLKTEEPADPLPPWTRNKKEADGKKKNTAVWETHRFRKSFRELEFALGGVHFKHELKGLAKDLDCRIENPHLLPEFQFVRPYFERVFKRKTLDVKLQLQWKGGEIIHQRASSPQISAIDASFLSSVKEMRVRDVLRLEDDKEDQHLYTPNDLDPNSQDRDERPEAIPPDPDELLRDILETRNVRNQEQLAYLAGKMQSAPQGIRFTLHPLFGFLFSVEGEEMYHFIWELLDSHATYLWSYFKEAPMDHYLKATEGEIGLIREHGRQQYRQSRLYTHSRKAHFQRIMHKYRGHPLKDSFTYWKHRLESKLV